MPGIITEPLNMVFTVEQGRKNDVLLNPSGFDISID